MHSAEKFADRDDVKQVVIVVAPEDRAAFLEKFPIDVYPTLLFIDPDRETVVLKWLGSADEAQMQALLVAARGGPGALRDADDARAIATNQVSLLAVTTNVSRTCTRRAAKPSRRMPAPGV
jgi:hypothetical protein